MKDMRMENRHLYSEKFKEHAYAHLSDPIQKWATIHEYRNFVDFCIIPMFRDWLEGKERKVSKK